LAILKNFRDSAQKMAQDPTKKGDLLSENMLYYNQKIEREKAAGKGSHVYMFGLNYANKMRFKEVFTGAAADIFGRDFYNKHASNQADAEANGAIFGSRSAITDPNVREWLGMRREQQVSYNPIYNINAGTPQDAQQVKDVLDRLPKLLEQQLKQMREDNARRNYTQQTMVTY
jgi:hypothetical protein